MKLVKVKSDVVVNNYIDQNTGELLDVELLDKSQTIIVDDSAAFSMLYGKIIGLVDGLDNTSIKVLIWSIINCSYNTNVVNLTKPMCTEIGKEYGLTYGSIKNAVSKLSKQNVLIAMGSGSYRINPRYSWRGNSNERKKTMKYVLEIECPNC